MMEALMVLVLVANTSKKFNNEKRDKSSTDRLIRKDKDSDSHFHITGSLLDKKPG